MSTAKKLIKAVIEGNDPREVLCEEQTTIPPAPRPYDKAAIEKIAKFIFKDSNLYLGLGNKGTYDDWGQFTDDAYSIYDFIERYRKEVGLPLARHAIHPRNPKTGLFDLEEYPPEDVGIENAVMKVIKQMLKSDKKP